MKKLMTLVGLLMVLCLPALADLTQAQLDAYCGPDYASLGITTKAQWDALSPGQQSTDIGMVSSMLHGQGAGSSQADTEARYYFAHD